MIGSLFKALASGLSLWESKEARKYLDELMDLKAKWYEEYNKEISDDGVLDSIELKLQLLCDSFTSQIGTAYLKD